MPIELGPNSLSSKQAPTLKKPPYLVTLTPTTEKSKSLQKFISLDKPESLNGFIQVKGIYCDHSEEEIIKNFAEILASSPKELILEMLFPLHRIISIRSLVFNAVKNVTNVTQGKE